MQLDRLRRMALFAMVVRHGSFSAASRALDLATSVLSSAVSQLEEELGVRLLNRTTRSLSLTEAGQLYHEKCVEMLAAAETAEEMVAGGVGEIAGRLRISAASDTAEKIILPALAPLARQHPKLLLDIVVDDRIVDMTTQAIDLSIRSGWLRDSSLVARKLADLHELLVAAPDYLRRFGVPASPESLREHRIIGFNRFAEPTTLTFKSATGESARIVLTPGAMTDNVAMLRDFAVQGFGLARLPSYMVQRELASGELVLLLPDWALPGAGIYAVTLKRTLQPPKVSAAIEAISNYLASLSLPGN
ncbi:LysR family transcriptional regulator [Cellvibrio sp. KY-YJ-3]|uniref:LysR family transcriptional regulator n=1 Tax=Cellvibrio sp. KY-YJ-3 TaxID=454662 RepID=UPI001245A1D5|nr:LysR family transcriptional regulator [Cellvibrio sp. KY-YJ-3]QEY11007.1 LysR family transcriptional regulator [Cellvibrio sp. KY-YJ-3]